MSLAASNSSITINGREYRPVFENGQLVGIKRYHSSFGMWVEMDFAKENLEVNQEILRLLNHEYVNQFRLD